MTNVIKEQVNELRRYVELYEKQPFGREVEGTVKVLSEAADTIESLSAKLQAENMERTTEDCSGWIPCIERLPEEDSDFIVTFRDGECVIAYLDENDKWVNSSTGLEIAIQVIAWHKLPSKYHEP